MRDIQIKDLDIKVNNGELIGIIGPNGCGKTALLKKIMGREDNKDIFIDNKSLNQYDIEFKRNNIVCVFNDNIFQSNKPKFELRYYINLIKNNDNNENIIKEFVEYFKLEEMLEIDFDDLGIGDRMYIKILSLLIITPKIFCLDDVLGYLTIDKKTKIINYIKEKDITLFCVTNDMEDLMLFDKLLVLSKGNKVMFDDTLKVLLNDNLFKDLGLKLPFIYDLNILLESYDLIKEKHLVSKELVDLLWK